MFKYGIITLLIFSLFGCLENKKNISDKSEKTAARVKDVKPGAPVRLMSNSLLHGEQGVPLTFDILLDVNETEGKLNVKMSASKELNILNASTQTTLDLAQNKIIKIPVILNATTNGRFYLNLFTELVHAGSTSVRNLTVIIQVGPDSTSTSQLRKISGDPVVILPAKETIFK